MEQDRHSLEELAGHAVREGDPEAALRALVALREEIDAYERFQVARALDAGASFGDIARVLGISRQAAHRRYRDLVGVELEDPRPEPVERRGRVLVTSEARAAVQLARDEAGRLGASAVGSEHLLLGILRSQDRRAAGALQAEGVTLDAARMAAMPTLVEAAPAPSEPQRVEEGPSGISPYARATFEQSLREAVQRGDGYIGVDHLLLAALADPTGGAARTLDTLGVAPASVRERLEP
jgi:hypothetical protein